MRPRLSVATSPLPAGKGALPISSSGPDPRVDCDVLETIVETPSLRLAAWRCATRHREWSEERVHTFDGIAFPRDVPFSIWSGRGAAVADRSVVLLHSAGIRYRTRHPFGVGDRGVVVIRRGPATGVSEGRPGTNDFRIVPRSPRAHFLQEILFRRAAGDDPAGVEELSALLEAEVSRTASRRPPFAGARLSAAIEITRVRLAGDLRRKTNLAELAHPTGYSPFHLARSFLCATGVTLRKYRIRARLFAALPYLLEPSSDLMAIALDVGFSSHSHFTAAFRGEFGMSPSGARRLARLPAGAIASVLRETAAASV